jgi:hypothetical protein
MVMPNEFYLATISEPDGSTRYELTCGRSVEEATRFMKGRVKTGTIVSMDPREGIEWAFLGEPLSPAREMLGRTVHSLRDHLLAGGWLVCDYRGKTYQAEPSILPEPREIMTGKDEDGEVEITVELGTVTIHLDDGSRRSHTFTLDGLDEMHAIDHLNGDLLLFDARIDGDTTATKMA